MSNINDELSKENRGNLIDNVFTNNMSGPDYKLGQIVMTKTHLQRVGYNIKKAFKINWSHIARIYKLPRYEEPGYVIPERIVIIAVPYQPNTIVFENDLERTYDDGRSYFIYSKHVGDLDATLKDIRYYYTNSVAPLYKNIEYMYHPRRLAVFSTSRTIVMGGPNYPPRYPKQEEL